MASTFEERFAAFAGPALYSEFGETVTFTAFGVAAVSISAIVIRGELERSGPTDSGRWEYAISVWVQKSDVSDPRPGKDKFALKRRTDDSVTTTYTVHAILNQDGAQWHLGLT